jgi:preprotein translocase subunit SecF
MRLIPDKTNIDFMALRWIGFAISGGLCVLSLVWLLWQGLNFGIDFRGGILMEVRAQQTVDMGAVRSKLDGLGLGEVALQGFGLPTDLLIRVQAQEGGERAQQAAVEKVKQRLGPGYEFRRTEFVGPKVGGELVRAGVIATVLAMLGIGLYMWFRFEWQYGIAALLALMHDVLTTLGIYSLTQYDFNLSTVAAVLTIAGYSINDTVVVFDRVRENVRKYKKMPLLELLNLSCNETLSRTILTSSTTFIAVLALYLVGGEALHSFSFGMLWGIIAGTYSSVLMACPLLLYMRPRRGASSEAAAPEVAGGQKA